MSVAHTLTTLADMAENYDSSRQFSANWIWGALSIRSHHAISKPAVAAVEKAYPNWREWTREEAAQNLRALAGNPDVENAALQSALDELEETRRALGKALGIHPASIYHLSQMVDEVAKKLGTKEPKREEKPQGRTPAPEVLRRMEAAKRRVTDVPLPGMAGQERSS